MHNTHTTSLFKTWVKNVYSLWANTWITGAYMYTAVSNSTTHPAKQRVQPSTFTHYLDSFTPGLYTRKFSYFNLLNTYLYTLSTPPIIKKTK